MAVGVALGYRYLHLELERTAQKSQTRSLDKGACGFIGNVAEELAEVLHVCRLAVKARVDPIDSALGYRLYGQPAEGAREAAVYSICSRVILAIYVGCKLWICRSATSEFYAEQACDKA